MAYQLDGAQVTYRVPVDFITRVNGCYNDGATTYKFIDNKLYLMYNTICSLKSYCECGEIGRHKRLKISRPKWRAGSIPATRTKFRAFSSCWLEQWTHNPLVVCSTHTGPTKILTDISESWVSG